MSQSNAVRQSLELLERAHTRRMQELLHSSTHLKGSKAAERLLGKSRSDGAESTVGVEDKKAARLKAKKKRRNEEVTLEGVKERAGRKRKARKKARDPSPRDLDEQQFKNVIDETLHEAHTDYTETNKHLLQAERFQASSEVQKEIMRQLLDRSS